jgi:hypothetical protein
VFNANLHSLIGKLLQQQNTATKSMRFVLFHCTSPHSINYFIKLVDVITCIYSLNRRIDPHNAFFLQNIDKAIETKMIHEVLTETAELLNQI